MPHNLSPCSLSANLSTPGSHMSADFSYSQLHIKAEVVGTLGRGEEGGVRGKAVIEIMLGSGLKMHKKNGEGIYSLHSHFHLSPYLISE